MLLYRLTAWLIYGILYPVGRLRIMMATGVSRELWRGRLGRIDPVSPGGIWMHAASVGELKVIGYLIDYLRSRNSTLAIHITVMTKAGYRLATERMAGVDDTITVSFLPLDASGPVRRTLDRIRPAMLVIAETEIWPNLISQAHRGRIPVVLVNGRMSEKSYRRYHLVRRALASLLTGSDRFFFKTESDFRRFRNFGVTAEQAVVAGDMKFDAPLLPHSEGRRQEIRSRAGVSPDDFLLVAGSTRSGEETILADLVTVIGDRQLRLVIAPRHVERVAEIKAMLDSKKLPAVIYGQSGREPVILVDRMGLMNDLYLAADLAFVGGTLVDIGGHNILEPVWASTPVLFGPYLSNVAEAAEYIVSHNYGVGVDSGPELAQTVKQVMARDRTFAIKTENDRLTSPTAVIGNYILKKLQSA